MSDIRESTSRVQNAALSQETTGRISRRDCLLLTTAHNPPIEYSARCWRGFTVFLRWLRPWCEARGHKDAAAM
jgi:hypothetical protein